MKLIDQHFEVINSPSYSEALSVITDAASTCYKSRPKNKERFVSGLIKSGHTSTIEHMSLTFRLVTDRAVTHELVRHRIASYSQESQRYCAYRDDVTFIIPHWVDLKRAEGFRWSYAMQEAEFSYKKLLSLGVRPEDARAVLPNSCATEIVCTFNFRSLINFFVLRTARAAHPDIRRFARELLTWCQDKYPAFFGHIDPRKGDKGH